MSLTCYQIGRENFFKGTEQRETNADLKSKGRQLCVKCRACLVMPLAAALLLSLWCCTACNPARPLRDRSFHIYSVPELSARIPGDAGYDLVA